MVFPAEQCCEAKARQPGEGIVEIWCPRCECRLLPGHVLSSVEATDIPGTKITVHVRCHDPYACPSCGDQHNNEVFFRCRTCKGLVCILNVVSQLPATGTVPDADHESQWYHVIGRAKIVCGLTEVVRRE